MPELDLPHMLTIREVAGFLRVSKEWVRLRVERGELPAHRWGKVVRISSADLLRWLEEADNTSDNSSISPRWAR